jgi:hypothetical protein
VQSIQSQCLFCCDWLHSVLERRGGLTLPDARIKMFLSVHLGAALQLCILVQRSMFYLPPYLTRIEGPPPKRNVVRSSRAGGAKTTAVSRFLMVYSGFDFYFSRWNALCHVCKLDLNGCLTLAQQNRVCANWIFGTDLPPGTAARNAVRLFDQFRQLARLFDQFLQIPCGGRRFLRFIRGADCLQIRIGET